MTITTFNALKSNKVLYSIPENTNDLINGLFLTINTTSKDFDYANAYEILPEVVSKFYDCIGSKPFSLKPYIIAPTKNDIDIASIGSQVFAVCSIGLNKTGEKIHIHMWIYNLHSFNIFKVPRPQASIKPALKNPFAKSGLKGFEGCLVFSRSTVQLSGSSPSFQIISLLL